MMPTIRIDEDVWKFLQEEAIPFEDTPNSVLRRLLDLDNKFTKPEDTNKKVSKKKVINRTVEAMYRPYILDALIELNGRGKVEDILKIVEKKMKHLLNPPDYESLPISGLIRWRNAAMWERKHMITDGLLKNNSLRGYWEITEKGRAYKNNVHPTKIS
jgi:hypothetical protein